MAVMAGMEAVLAVVQLQMGFLKQLHLPFLMKLPGLPPMRSTNRMRLPMRTWRIRLPI